MSMTPVTSMFSTMDLLRKQRNAGFEDDKARWTQEQAEKKAGWDDEDRDVTVKERKRLDELRQGLIDSAKDADIEEVDITGADGATSKAFKIGGKQYTNRSEAEAAREFYNSRGSKIQRGADLTLSMGNPTGAAALSETGMKWDQSMREDVKRRFEADFANNVKLGDWQGLENFVNNSPISPAKARFVIGKDGRQQAVGEDGKPIPGMSFPNTPEGHAEASKLLFGRLTPEQQLAHIYGRQQVAATAAQQQVVNTQNNRRIASEEKRVALAGNADTRAAEEHTAGASGRALARQMDELRLAAVGNDPVAAKAAQEKLVQVASVAAIGKGKPQAQYKIEMNEVATALGKPSGKADPFTGRETVNRDLAEEARFFEWMEANGLTDTNEGLARWKAGAGRTPTAVAPNPAAVEHLKKNPALAADFDAKYGPGAAKRALGQ